MRRLGLLAFPLLIAAAPDGAGQGTPAIRPLRDVDVTYAIAQPDNGPSALSQRMRWSVARGRLRVDPPAPDMYMVVDYPARRMMVVRPEDKAVLDLDTAGPGLPGAPSDGQYARTGADTVLGMPCANWQVTDASGQKAVLCLTADGVMLRASRDGQTLLQATAVTYAPQDPAAFDAPPGFHHFTPGTKP